MRKRYILAGLLVVLLVAALAAIACGSTETTTTTAAAPSTTAAPSTETTAAPSTETTAAPSTETTAAAGPATGEPIKIGLSNSLTGVSAAPGISIEKGVKLQIEYVNANGGIYGRPLQLIEYDDKSDIPTAVANVNKLVQEDKVFATIGPFAQFNQEPARQIAEQAKVPMVGGGPATLAQLAGNQYQWSVMVPPAPPVQADATEKAIKAGGYKNILAIADVLTPNQETLDIMAKDAATEGYTFTRMTDTVELAQTDVQPILNKMMRQIAIVKPDAIVLNVNMLPFPALYKGLRSLNVDLPIIGAPSAAHPAIFAMGPEAVEGAYIMDVGGVLNPQGLPDSWPLKALQVDFATRYLAKYNEPPDMFAATGGDWVILVKASMEQAGEVDQAKFAQALINLKDVPALEGVVSFTPDATSMGIHGDLVLWQVKNGQFEFIQALN